MYQFHISVRAQTIVTGSLCKTSIFTGTSSHSLLDCDTNIWEDRAASIFRLLPAYICVHSQAPFSSPWRWRQHGHLKH